MEGQLFSNGLVVRGNLSKTKLLSFCHTQHNKLLWSGKAFFFKRKDMIYVIAMVFF